MNQITFNPPAWRWDDDNNAHDILNLKRGQTKRLGRNGVVNHSVTEFWSQQFGINDNLYNYGKEIILCRLVTKKELLI